jgi:MerR family transcriptional regulator, heat shock protein HspR
MSQKYYHRRQIVELFNCDEEFLEELEAEEIVSPVQVASEKERVFPEDQVERIRVISNLIRDLDVNLPGAEVILEMRENMIRMQQRFDRILEALLEQFKGRMR